MADDRNLVSQAAEFLQARQQEQKETNAEHRAFRLALTGVAAAFLAKGYLARRGR